MARVSRRNSRTKGHPLQAWQDTVCSVAPWKEHKVTEGVTLACRLAAWQDGGKGYGGRGSAEDLSLLTTCICLCGFSSVGGKNGIILKNECWHLGKRASMMSLRSVKLDFRKAPVAVLLHFSQSFPRPSTKLRALRASTRFPPVHDPYVLPPVSSLIPLHLIAGTQGPSWRIRLHLFNPVSCLIQWATHC